MFRRVFLISALVAALATAAVPAMASSGSAQQSAAPRMRCSTQMSLSGRGHRTGADARFCLVRNGDQVVPRLIMPHCRYRGGNGWHDGDTRSRCSLTFTYKVSSVNGGQRIGAANVTRASDIVVSGSVSAYAAGSIVLDGFAGISLSTTFQLSVSLSLFGPVYTEESCDSGLQVYLFSFL